MKTRYLIVSVVAVAIVATVTLRPSRAQNARDDGKFDDKYIIVYKKSDSDTPWALEKVHLSEFAGQTYLVGVGTETGVAPKWYLGTTIWIASNDISSLEVFPSRWNLQEAYKPQPPIAIQE